MKQPQYLTDRNNDCLECFANFRLQNRICREFCAVRLRCLIERDLRVDPNFFDDDMFISEEFSLRIQ